MSKYQDHAWRCVSATKAIATYVCECGARVTKTGVPFANPGRCRKCGNFKFRPLLPDLSGDPDRPVQVCECNQVPRNGPRRCLHMKGATA